MPECQKKDDDLERLDNRVVQKKNEYQIKQKKHS